jgi:enoyl-CoA hydratase/carnithine racemase
LTLQFDTIIYTVGEDHVATVTLNRPDSLNAFNQQMCDEFAEIWRLVRESDEIHAVVLQAAGERAFSTGVDVKSGLSFGSNVWNQPDPGRWLSPKQNKVWKPVVCAARGMVAGGALYWLNESDIVICTPETTFFDPHVSYGLTAALEPIGLSRRIPLGEVLRMALLGLDERMSAERALTIGLVTEIVPADDLRRRAHELAAAIAEKPPAAVQGTVRAIWESLEVGRQAALDRGLAYTQIGNPIGTADVDRSRLRGREWRLR